MDFYIIAAKLAHEKCNCTVEEARQKFGIECDMTEEEIAEIDKHPLDQAKHHHQSNKQIMRKDIKERYTLYSA